MIEHAWVLAADEYGQDVNHWAEDRDDDLIVDFGLDKDICHEALASALGVDGDYDEDAMHNAFLALPVSRKASSLFTQPELLETYIESTGRSEDFNLWYEERYSGGPY